MKEPYRLYIKGIDPAPNASESMCVVGCTLFDPKGAILESPETEEYTKQSGPMLRALVERTTKIIERLPPHSTLAILTDFAAFWKAFHPGYAWLDAWEKQGFQKRPAHNPDAWRKLAEVCRDRDIKIDVSGCENLSDSSRGTLIALKNGAREWVFADSSQD